jgi:glycosyltransferase involved in cell wall biosynthesis
VPFDRRVWQESLALIRAGYEVHVICPRGRHRDRRPYEEIGGVRIHRFPLDEAAGGVPSYLVEYARALFGMLRLTLRLERREPFDVVHVCNPPDLLFLVAIPSKLRGSSFVFDHHDLVPELLRSRFGERHRLLHGCARFLERCTFAMADAVISTNESYRRVAIDRGHVDPRRVWVVRNGPDLGRFRPVAPDPTLKRGASHLACYLGVMGYQDGVDYALRALAHLKYELGRDDFHATFIGNGDAFEDNRALAHELRLGGCVEFTGRVSDEVVLQYLSTADVCLAPDPSSPLNDVSTMTKIMEYMAMARPIVAFDLVENRVSAAGAALYARANDERQFAQLVAALFDDPQQRAEMGRVGRERVEGGLDWSHSERRLVALYGELLARRAGGRPRQMLRS